MVGQTPPMFYLRFLRMEECVNKEDKNCQTTISIFECRLGKLKGQEVCVLIIINWINII